jgi:hypothetical protein
MVWASIDANLATTGDGVLSLWTASKPRRAGTLDVQFDRVSIASAELGTAWLQVSQAFSGLNAQRRSVAQR